MVAKSWAKARPFTSRVVGSSSPIFLPCFGFAGGVTIFARGGVNLEGLLFARVLSVGTWPLLQGARLVLLGANLILRFLGIWLFLVGDMSTVAEGHAWLLWLGA